MRIILMVIGSLLLLYGLMMLTITNLNMGLFSFVIVGVIMLACGYKYKSIQSFFIRHKKVKMVLLSILFIILLAGAYLETNILIHSANDQVEEVDYILVLGSGINGNEPSLTLKNRLNKAIALGRKFSNVQFIVSGGKGIGKKYTEAEVMESYLVENGIAKNRIHKEERATSTYENFAYAKEIIEQETYTPRAKVVFVTSDFHIYRSKYIANKLGYNSKALGSPTPTPIIPQTHIREIMAIIKTKLFD